jgi:hypothetical protein
MDKQIFKTYITKPVKASTMNIRNIFTIAIPLAIAGSGFAQKASPARTGVNIDMADSIGTIRPLHGGNLGPVSALKVLDFTDFFKECKIPLIRLHDAPWFNTYAVDISTIFRDFREDPSDPDNYDFRQTDDYIAAVLNSGAKIMYRLGESIEWTKRKYNVNPPKDFEKWAAICCGIIRHYNEGWANGFHYNIKYWEIWNEPDGKPKDSTAPSTWMGSPEQYYELYGTAARAIKKSFPDIKVGGPVVARPITYKNGKDVVAGFVTGFLDYCRKNSLPLDFFSWHRYDHNPWKLAQLPAMMRETLDQHGFTGTESILDEWNYTPPSTIWATYPRGEERVKWYNQQTSAKGGAFLADVLMLLQDEPVDQTTFYTTTNGAYGLFSDLGEIHKYAYAFKAFAWLVNNTPVRLKTSHDKNDSLVICAGANKDRTEANILISNFTGSSKEMDIRLDHSFFDRPVKYELYAVDEKNSLTMIKSAQLKKSGTIRLTEKINGPAVLLLKLSAY